MVVLPPNLLTSSGSVLEGFELAADWTATNCVASNSTSHFVQGTQGVRTVNNVAASCYITKTIATDCSILATTNLRVHVWIDNVAKMSTLRVYIGSNANPGVMSFNYTAVAANLRNGWNVLDIGPSMWTNTGGESWANLMIRIRCFVATKAGVTTDVYWDNMLMGVVGTPALCLTVDDGHRSVYDNGKPVMDAHKQHATWYIPTGTIDSGADYLTQAEALACQAAGWVMATHTQSHTDLDTLTQAQAEAELDAALTDWDTYGLRGWRHDAGVGGAGDYTGPSTTTRSALTSRRLLSHRCVDYAYWLTLPQPDWLQVPAYMVRLTDTLATVQGWVDVAAANRHCLPLLFHHIHPAADCVDATDWALEDFTTLMAYCVSSGLQTVTIADLRALESGSVAVAQNV